MTEMEPRVFTPKAQMSPAQTGEANAECAVRYPYGMRPQARDCSILGVCLPSEFRAYHYTLPIKMRARRAVPLTVRLT
jgi:hypothetical protein